MQSTPSTSYTQDHGCRTGGQPPHCCTICETEICLTNDQSATDSAVEQREWLAAELKE